MRLGAAVAVVLLLVLALPVEAARPAGSDPGASAPRGGGKSYPVYLIDGRVLRSKWRPVFLYGRCVFTTTEGRPMNLDQAEVDRPRTDSGREQPEAPAVVTNRELRMPQGRFATIETGEIDLENPRGAARKSPGGDAATEGEPFAGEAEQPPGEAAPGPDANQRLRSIEIGKLMNQRTALQQRMQALQTQRSGNSDPDAREKIDAEISRLREEVADLTAQINSQTR